ncbi:MAG: leucine dehydrogenase [Ignavibacteriales bacterium CG_4_9_14_3_um_filter_34_10]|nr:MAG: leucine dehydrogenase [Ignavibacteriales bacterium CG_4_9_14_3_um_filter_34_10]
MNNFELLSANGHEQLVYCLNEESGLKAVIAIHDTTLGPALGGTRMINYSSESEAVSDALRLSKAMTYKAAVAGLNFGGGKAVIMKSEKTEKSELLFRTFGKFVDGLGGRFIAAEDMGTDVKDMEFVRMETKYVTGISKAIGGSGDPTPVTAYGVYIGMKASANQKWGNDSLRGRKIAIQGAGQVARHLSEYLYNEGAELYITDIDNNKIKRLLEMIKATVVSPEEIYDVNAEIFSPCAIGGTINLQTIPRLKCEIVAGGANNQLQNENTDGKLLLDKNILYAPDYVINAGGLINVANELEGYRQDRAMKQAENIFSILKRVFTVSADKNIPTNEASARIAEERLQSISKIRNIYSGSSYFSGRLGELTKKS